MSLSTTKAARIVTSNSHSVIWHPMYPRYFFISFPPFWIRIDGCSLFQDDIPPEYAVLSFPGNGVYRAVVHISDYQHGKPHRGVHCDGNKSLGPYLPPAVVNVPLLGWPIPVWTWWGLQFTVGRIISPRSIKSIVFHSLYLRSRWYQYLVNLFGNRFSNDRRCQNFVRYDYGESSWLGNYGDKSRQKYLVPHYAVIMIDLMALSPDLFWCMEKCWFPVIDLTPPPLFSFRLKRKKKKNAWSIGTISHPLSSRPPDI